MIIDGICEGWNVPRIKTLDLVWDTVSHTVGRLTVMFICGNELCKQVNVSFCHHGGVKHIIIFLKNVLVISCHTAHAHTQTLTNTFGLIEEITLFFGEKLILLSSRDALNWSNVTMLMFTLLSINSTSNKSCSFELSIHQPHRFHSTYSYKISSPYPFVSNTFFKHTRCSRYGGVTRNIHLCVKQRVTIRVRSVGVCVFLSFSIPHTLYHSYISPLPPSLFLSRLGTGGEISEGICGGDW